MRKLFIMRHGETLFNKRGKIQGRCDSPLTKEGRSQALAIRDYFNKRKIHFDHLYTSPLARAMDTGDLVSQAPMTRLRNLIEWSFGRMEGESRDLITWYDNHPDAPSYEDFFVQFGGENRPQVVDRFRQGLDEIIKDGYETNLAVTHGAAMWAWLLSREETWVTGGLFIANCAVLEYDIDEDGGLHFDQIYNPFAIGSKDYKEDGKEEDQD